MKKIFNSLNLVGKIVFCIWSICSIYILFSKGNGIFSKIITIIWGYVFYISLSKIIEKHLKKKRKNNTLQGETYIISNFSDFPRYYTIDGIKYDIDNPQSIDKIPLFKKTFFINGTEYGMDSILMEHGKQAYSKNIQVHQASIEKAKEFRYNGYIFKTEKEKNDDYILKQRWKKQEEEKQKRIEQCNSFKIEDMYQFVNIPFEWQYVQKLSHTNGKAWFMLNMNNQYVAFKYIDILDKLISEFRECNFNLKNFEIFMEEIDFFYPVPMYKDSIPNTYVECIPYTKTGKKSRYPVILHFASSITRESEQIHPYIGEIKILQDGNIGNATVTFIKKYTKFTFGLHGINLIIKRIDDINGNIYKFEE